MSGKRLSSRSETSSLGSSARVEKSISEARSERCLRTRSSTIAGMAKIFLRAGSFMHGVFRARVEPGVGVGRQYRRIRGAATWLNRPDDDPERIGTDTQGGYPLAYRAPNTPNPKWLA